MLEHVDDPDRVIAEITRVLEPGGVFLYDTINRTLLSKVLLITVAQDWPATRVAPPGLHDWRRFIRPAELRRIMVRHGLDGREAVGLRPRASPLAMLRELRRFKRGAITHGELGRRLVASAAKDCSVSYMGYALKPAEG